MKVDAEVELGVAKNPVIRNFVFPWRLILLGSGIPQFLLIFITFSSSTYANMARAHIPPSWIIFSWEIVVVLHSLEAIYTAILCKTYKTGLHYGSLWTLTTLLFGYPSWIQLKKLVQQARIDSIIKGE
ncbi:hypothetical protein FRC03_007925 [Tulasnella sp. 419]|nr:hypothetical protein FRC03_007925 [Tulasnella sp. 419]